jgi:hypothetical protein
MVPEDMAQGPIQYPKDAMGMAYRRNADVPTYDAGE